MTGKEIVRRNIAFDGAPRIAFGFIPPGPSDIAGCAAVAFKPIHGGRFSQWGTDPELLRLARGFNGEVRMDDFGNIYGRLEGRTKGECVVGVLEDGFDALDNYSFQPLSPEYDASIEKRLEGKRDKYLLSGLPVAIFSTLRDMRKMENALTDTIENPERVRQLLTMIGDIAVKAVEAAGRHGMDGVMMTDDWGTQIALLINPKAFRELFLPVYKRVADAAHERGMHFMLHSCGYIYQIIPDLIAAGVDVLQLDQPELTGLERISAEFAGKVTLYSPVDIQMIMKTGDREKIVDGARRMVEFARRHGGGLIAKDYGAWGDIGVTEEWAAWARDYFVANATL